MKTDEDVLYECPDCGLEMIDCNCDEDEDSENEEEKDED